MYHLSLGVVDLSVRLFVHVSRIIQKAVEDFLETDRNSASVSASAPKEGWCSVSAIFWFWPKASTGFRPTFGFGRKSLRLSVICRKTHIGNIYILQRAHLRFQLSSLVDSQLHVSASNFELHRDAIRPTCNFEFVERQNLWVPWLTQHTVIFRLRFRPKQVN